MACKYLGAVLVFFIMLHEMLAYNPYRHNGNYKVCGKQLVNLMSYVCNKRYYSPNPPSKKSVSFEESYEYNENPWNDYPEESNLEPASGYVYLDKLFNLGYSQLKQEKNRAQLKFKRGIVEECCHTSCTFENLLRYCE